MPDITDVKDTISKLLALSGSPNEHEAKAALLKARELMAKHKLREADIEQVKNAAVVDRLTKVTCTKMTNSWVVWLSNIIAEHYCCRSYRVTTTGRKVAEIGLIGLEGDIDICERIFEYAFNCVADECRRIRKFYKEQQISAATTRKIADAYGVGFCGGLLKAYREQDGEHQEYGLVLITPQQVLDAHSALEDGGSYVKAKFEKWQQRFTELGYRDGLKFDPSTKLPDG